MSNHTDRTDSRRVHVLACALAVVAVGLAGPRPAGAQITPGSITIDLQPVASGLTAPLALVESPDATGRLFVSDQAGKIRIIQSGTLLPTPFLDLSNQASSNHIPVLNTGYDERGLLGMAFHPNFAINGRVFVRYSAPRTGTAGEPCFGTSRGCHEEILAEFHVSAGDPNVLDPVGTILFRVNKPQFNHNGGTVAFGPDGYLYFALGDGGGANDGLADVPPSHGPIGNAQNTGVPLGKMLRLDVSTSGSYSIPPTNVFAPGGARPGQGLPEVYAYGLRNPYAFSFDDRAGGTNLLYLGDVGQNLFEELDIILSGGNYGWVTREGRHCFDPFHPTIPPPTCSTTGPSGEPLIDPVIDYAHTAADSTADGIAIIAGFIYRGAQYPELYGRYVFGDLSRTFGGPQGRLFYLNPLNPTQVLEFRIGVSNTPLGLFLHGFGRDAAGEIYVLAQSLLGPTGATGVVLHLAAQASCPATPNGDLNGDGLTNGDDAQLFVSAVLSGNASASVICRADFSLDSAVTSADVPGFVLALLGP